MSLISLRAELDVNMTVAHKSHPYQFLEHVDPLFLIKYNLLLLLTSQ